MNREDRWRDLKHRHKGNKLYFDPQGSYRYPYSVHPLTRKKSKYTFRQHILSGVFEESEHKNKSVSKEIRLRLGLGLCPMCGAAGDVVMHVNYMFLCKEHGGYSACLEFGDGQDMEPWLKLEYEDESLPADNYVQPATSASTSIKATIAPMLNTLPSSTPTWPDGTTEKLYMYCGQMYHTNHSRSPKLGDVVVADGPVTDRVGVLSRIGEASPWVYVTDNQGREHLTPKSKLCVLEPREE